MSEENKKELNNLICTLEMHHIDSTIIFKMQNIIKSQQEVIEKLKEDNKKLDLEAQGYLEQLLGDNSLTKRTIKQLNKELEKKDKIKNKMIKELARLYNSCEPCELSDKVFLIN